MQTSGIPMQGKPASDEEHSSYYKTQKMMRRKYLPG